MPLSKPFDNKSNYDPGRFRATLVFRPKISTPKPSGGSTVTYGDPIDIKAVEEQVKSYDQMAIDAGATVLNLSRYFVIRKRRTWMPSKDDGFTFDGGKWIIKAIIPVDSPTHYYKLLAVRNNA